MPDRTVLLVDDRRAAAAPVASRIVGPTLTAAFTASLDHDRVDELWLAVAREPVDERDALAALEVIHDLHLGDVRRVGRRARWQHHPAVATLKGRLEQRVLDAVAAAAAGVPDPDGDAVQRLRAVAAADLVPPVYEWLAEDATADQVVRFLALEGGPDASFDDLVAMAQVGLDGEAKLEMAVNYWDEMGRGVAQDVHTELHRRMAAALGLSRCSGPTLPVEGLRRTVLAGVLATNRHLQPEQLGALGLTELQAGPRCRKVVRALERIGAPADALPFYREHAVADPRHGKAWLDRVVASLGDDPGWADGMVRGARWRSAVNGAFFRAAALASGAPAAALSVRS